MKIDLLTSFVLIFIGIFCQVSNGDFATAKAVQIVTPVNHTFQLELNDLKRILEADDIKDRHVAIVSIAGAYRKGKSFLSNFFIRYLYAQYKIHDVSDWLGENENSSSLGGFKWRSGQKPETTGIWMWSEIFTHDFENGEKVAIILMDTQGIFDSRSSLQDCTTIFALSMMLSSVQCYNVMQNVQENDLQHLELFTEYGRMVLDQTNKKPFQYLLFIVRDWAFPDENPYGWGQTVIDTLLAENEDQTPEMHQLRQRINSSFEEIGAFMMPYPGSTVALRKNFNGNLKQIDPEFLNYVKLLVPSIFAPENLVLKRINGEKIRARDLVKYIQVYLNIFNGKTLPEPKTVLWATAEASNLILLNDALDFYTESMKNAFRNVSSYISPTELLEIHKMAKNESISQFMQKIKLGSDDMISSFIHRIENTTEEQFLSFQQENSEQQKTFIDTANLLNEKISMEIQINFEKKILNSIESSSDEYLKELLETTKESALNEFNAKKVGGSDISSRFSEELQSKLTHFQATIETMLTSYKDSVRVYSELMRNELNNVNEYATHSALTNMHQNSKNKAITQFQTRAWGIATELITSFQHRIENEIERKYNSFAQENDVQRDNYFEKTRIRNAQLQEQIESERRRLRYIESEHKYRTIPTQPIIHTVTQTKNSNYYEYIKAGGFAAGGATAGAVIAGPAGAVIGGLIGALASLF